MEPHNTQNCPGNPEEKEQSWRYNPSIFLPMLQVSVIKTVWQWHQDRQNIRMISEWNRIKSQEIDTYMDNWFSRKVERHICEESIFFLINDAGTMDVYKQNKHWFVSCIMYKNLNQNGLDLKMKSKTLNLLVENIGENL